MYKFFVVIFVVLFLTSPLSFSDSACKRAIKNKSTFRHFILEKEIFDNFSGIGGLFRFADEFFDGDMGKAFNKVLSVLSKTEFQSLRWDYFYGSTKDFKDIKRLLVDEKGNIVDTYMGMDGLARLADERFNRNMITTFKNSFAVLGKQKFRQLKWNYFSGGTKDYEKVKTAIKNRNFFEDFSDMKGYILLANEIFDGNMWKTYLNFSAILGKEKIKKMGWWSFKGSTKEFEDLRNLFVDEKGNIVDTYRDMIGYVLLADKHFDGNMWDTYLNVSAVLNREELQMLDWEPFNGSTKDFEKVKTLTKNEDFYKDFSGMEGLAQLADMYFKGNMIVAFKNISALLVREKRNQLGWYYFSGTTKTFENLRNAIKSIDFYDRFYGMKGQVRFADKYFKGNMTAAFDSFYAVVSGNRQIIEEDLAWIKFGGYSTKYKQLVHIFEETPFNQLKGSKGQKIVADKIFRGSMKRAFYSVSSLRSELLTDPKLFRQLNWSISDFQ